MRIKVLCLIAVALTASSSAPAQTSGVTRTPWQMHKGAGVTYLTLAVKGFGTRDNYTKASIPAKDDAGWQNAPDAETIAFGSDTSSEIKGRDPNTHGKTCRKALDYTYFQTFVTVPTNTKVEEFKITFQGMDDGARISVFGPGDAKGQIVDGSYVEFNKEATSDLRDLMKPGVNRVVITQVDVCPPGNRLDKALVELNGKDIPPEPQAPPKNEDVKTNGRGDVHYSTPDGLTFDFHGVGTYQALLVTMKNKNGEDYKALSLEPTTVAWPKNPKASINTKLRITSQSETDAPLDIVATVDPEPKITVGGKTVTISTQWTSLDAGLKAIRGFDGIYLSRGFWTARIVLHPGKPGYLDYGVKLNPGGVRTGILGNVNGNPRDDFAFKDGRKLSPPASQADINAFGQSWQIHDPVTTIADGKAVSDAEQKKAEKKCENAGVVEKVALKECGFDVAVTGDKRFIDTAKVTQDEMNRTPIDQRVGGDKETAAAIEADTAPDRKMLTSDGRRLPANSFIEYRGTWDFGSGGPSAAVRDANLVFYSPKPIDGKDGRYCYNLGTKPPAPACDAIEYEYSEPGKVRTWAVRRLSQANELLLFSEPDGYGTIKGEYWSNKGNHEKKLAPDATVKMTLIHPRP